MDNQEEIYHLLEEFENQKSKEIPRELEEYLNFVAKTGDPLFMWQKVKYLFQQKLQQVLCDYYDSCPNNDILQCPNVDQFSFDVMKNKILERLESFSSAPFTIQRLSELLTCPRKEYNRTDKFMRAVEKNILVVTTREPGNSSVRSVVNGVAEDRSHEEESMQVDTPALAASSSSGSALAAVSCGNASGKPLNGLEDEDEEEEEEEEEISEEDEEEDSLESVHRGARREAQCDDIHTAADTLPDSPDRETDKSIEMDSATVNGHFKSQDLEKTELSESASPPESSNFNSSDKLMESSESSSSSLPGDSSEPFNSASASQDFSSSSEENYQDSNSGICDTVEAANDNSENSCHTLEDISLPPEPCNKDSETESLVSECAETNTSKIESPHDKEPQPNKIHDVADANVYPEPPSKRMCLSCDVSSSPLPSQSPVKPGKKVCVTETPTDSIAAKPSTGSCAPTSMSRSPIVHTKHVSSPSTASISLPSTEKFESSQSPSVASSKTDEEVWREETDGASKSSAPSIEKSSEDEEKISKDSLSNGSENDITT